MRWLHAFAPVTYLCMLPGTYALAAFLQPELFRGYTALISYLKLPVHGLHAFLGPELFRGCGVILILKTVGAWVACLS